MTGAQLLPKVIRSGLADALSRFGPAPGTGPRPETLDEWSYRIDVHAVTASGDSADVTVEALGHPGYKSTATLIGEAALEVDKSRRRRSSAESYRDKVPDLLPPLALAVLIDGRSRSAPNEDRGAPGTK